MKNARLFWRLSGWFLMAALFFGFGGGTLRAQDDIYELVTDASTLRTGDEVLIVGVYNASNIYAMAASEVKNSYSDAVTRQTAKVTVVDNTITNPTIAKEANQQKACVFTLEKNAEGKYAFHDLVNQKYLDDVTTAESTSSSTPFYFSIGINGDGTASINDGTNEIRLYSSTSFKGYGIGKTSTWYYAVYLYKKKYPETPYIQTDETEVRYRIDPTANLDENLFFRAGNLEDKVEVAVRSADEGREDAVISVDPEEISQDDANAAPFELTLTTSGLAEGTYKDIITLTSGDVTVEVTVNLLVKETEIYRLVTNAAKLKAGNEVLIVGEGGYAMTASEAGLYKTRGAVKVTVADNAITNPDIATAADEKKACVFTLDKDADGKYSFNDNLNTYKYLSMPNTSYGSNSPSSSTAFYFSVDIDAGTGVAAVGVIDDARLMRYYTSSSYQEFRFSANTTSSYKDIYFYKKQDPNEPTCDPVTLSDDGAAEPGENDVTLTWDAPAKGAPDNGYRVTVKGPKDYNKTVTVANTQTQIDWEAELEPETEYSFEIVSLCGEDNESDPVVGKFTTAHSTKPILDIQSPADNTVFKDDVTFVFITKGFALNATHLVKAEVRAKVTTNQAAAPIIQTVYTQAEALTITGLADGNYHVDLFMVEINGNDTAVVGFDGDNYVHRDIVVRHPALNFSTQNLKLTTYRGTSAEGKVTLTGVDLPTGSTVSVTSSDPNITVEPEAFTRAQVMSTKGAEVTVTFDGDVSAATATIMAICSGAALPATLTVNAIARDTLANLKGIYSQVANDTVLVRGKMVVTHKDTTNNRVWVQDIDRETGASMLLYNVTAARGYAGLKVGDVLKNVAGRVTISNGLYRFTPLANLTPEERGHAVYVDTMSLLEVRANSGKAEAQNALVCIKDVKFKQTGNFAANRNYALLQGQGKDTLAFRGYTMADYIGKPIPTARLYVTAIVGHDNGARVSARSLADMVNAPCLMPENITADAHENEAELDWDGLADNYSVRYATEESALESATPIAVDKSSCHITNLTASTTYYYQVKSVCGTDGYESEWSTAASFTTLAAGLPSIRMTSPVEFPTFTDSVLVTFTVKNVTLKASDTSARIVFSDGVTVDNYTDTVYKRAMPSGDYSVQVILVKDNAPLTPGVQTNVRYFSVDLPDVAAPVFTPKAGRYKDSVEVTLSCATQEATIFYARGEGEYTAYTEGEKIVIKETTTLKAYAAKERMDASAVATAAYTIYSTLKPEGDLIFAENFRRSKASNTAISNFDEVTDMPGWSGANMYPEAGRIKGGTTSKAGKLVSPAINLSNDNGKYYVAFFVQAYNNSADSTKIRLTAGDQSVLVTDLDKTGMFEYVYLFNNGTAETKITFEALAASYNRFFLDSIRVYQVLPGVPRLTVSPSVFEMNTVMGTPVSEKITVKGNLLSEDVTVTCPDGNFSVSAATLAAADVMGENGAELTVTFNGEVPSDNVEITLASGELSRTIAVTATATPVVVECEAPTQLNAVVADKNVTLTWNGAADKYRVVVLKLGEKEVCNEFVTGKNYSMSNLEVGTYAWMVASVCEEDEVWTNGENFEVKAVLANDDAEELSFRIYPNPTAGVFYVEVAEGARMEILTLGGATVRNEMLKAGKNEIRLDRSGIYFVRLTNATGSAVQRVIVL